MKLPIKLVPPDRSSGLQFPYIVDSDGVVIVHKCTTEHGRAIVEAVNNNRTAQS